MAPVVFPALQFRTMAKFRIENVDWTIMGAIFLGKAVLFVISYVAAFAFHRGEHRVNRGGIYALFTTAGWVGRARSVRGPT